MTKKLIQTTTNGDRIVKVYYDSDWNEYQCRLYLAGKFYGPATYFTNDKEDAIDSSWLMANPGQRKESRA